MSGKIPDNDLVRIVSETYMGKIHVTIHMVEMHSMFNRQFFFLFVQKFKYALGGCSHRLQHICHLRNLLDRLSKIPDILNKCLNFTNPDGSADCQKSSGNCHSDITEVSDKLHDRLHQSG